MARSLKQQNLKEVMDNFDFKKVHKVMQILNWTWGSYGKEKVPSITELKKTAKKLLKQAEKNSYGNVGTGGFHAYYHYKGHTFHLEFILARWDSE
jgi:hypothetical protein